MIHADSCLKRQTWKGVNSPDLRWPCCGCTGPEVVFDNVSNKSKTSERPDISGSSSDGSDENNTQREREVGALQGPVPGNICEICARSFTTKTGLGVHIRRSHAERANAAVNVVRKKAQWSLEELSLMARTEAELTLKGGVRFMNQELLKSFSHRSLEAVKGQRRSDVYRDLVNGYTAELATIPAAPARLVAAAVVEREIVEPETVEGGVGDRPDDSVDQLWPNPTLVPEPPGSDGNGGLAQVTRDLISEADRWRDSGEFQAQRLQFLAEEALLGRDVTQLISQWVSSLFPSDRPRNLPRGPPRGIGRVVHNRRQQRREEVNRTSQKGRRRKEYAKVQNLLRKSMSAGANYVLSGGHQEDQNPQTPSPAAMQEFWSGIFSSEPTGRWADDQVPNPVRELSELWAPVTIEEVTKNRVALRSAPGPDGITPREWAGVPPILRCLLYNVVLLTENLPLSLTQTRTTLIPKKEGELQASDFRPISVGSVVLRNLHKILARRIQGAGLFSDSQRAFMPADGVAENLLCLHATVDDAYRKLNQLHVASLDVAKAFDTVNHQAMLDIARGAGIPGPFIRYIGNLYASATTYLDLRGAPKTPIRVARGVRQGDPLSPLLFNLVIDYALGVLHDAVGYQLNDVRINSLAFADDVILLATTQSGMQRNLDGFSGRLRECGLLLNSQKSHVLSLVPSGKQKKMKVVEDLEFLIDGSRLPAIGLTSTWKYLGIRHVGGKVKLNDLQVEELLDKVTRAPLKPHQRMVILTRHLIPRFYHPLVLGRITKGFLRAQDVVIRARVRRWLHLPKDVPVEYFHASVRKGGLGVPSLLRSIPVLKKRRLFKISNSEIPHLAAAAATPYWQVQYAWAERNLPCNAMGLRIDDTRDLKQSLALDLYRAVDGEGLRGCDSAPSSYLWASDLANEMVAADFVRSHLVRVQALPTRARRNRGTHRPGPVECRAGCGVLETPYHVVQQCFRSHGVRIARHDELCRRVASYLEGGGWKVEREVTFKTDLGNRRPDLVCSKGERVAILDAQVISGTQIDLAHRDKLEKYRREDIVAPAARRHAVDRNNVSVNAITISWRGVWSKHSCRELRQLGLTNRQLGRLTPKVLVGSYMCFRTFEQRTDRRPVGWGGERFARQGIG